jgi:branched-chain amino acid transport system ATP-binding protein
MRETTAPYLCVRNLEAWYDESYVLQGIDFDVAEGEVVTLLGRNGAGKTTTLKAIMGLMPRASGSITFSGRDILGDAPHRIARAGIGYCPEERGIFGSLTVTENLVLPPAVAAETISLARIYEMFPNLAERRDSAGNKLSGGEQQMLAIGRILRTGARILLLDEPTEGLAPVIVQQIGRVIADMKRAGLTIVLVEQNFHFASQVADRHYVVERGRVIDMIPGAELTTQEAKLRDYLGV